MCCSTDAVNDSRTRPAHRLMDGIIKPINDPFWTTRYPPNGYRCRCTTVALTERQAAARGGVTQIVPTEAVPDSGWDYHGGEEASAGIDKALAQAQTTWNPQLNQALQSKLENGPPQEALSLKPVKEVMGSDYNRFLTEGEKAIESFGEGRKGLADEHLSTLYGYSARDAAWGHVPANRVLWGLALHDEAQRLMPAIVAMDAGLAVLPDHEGWVYRGTPLPDEAAQQYIVGSTVEEDAFTSSTFGDKAYPGMYQFRILSRHGKRIDFLSAFPEEKEVLFRPGTKFVVTSREVVDGEVRITMEETDG